MYPVFAILDSLVLYRYSLVLALAAAAGTCFFMACCSYQDIPPRRAAIVALYAVLLSLPLSRLVYWYGRPDSFASFAQVFTSPATTNFALAGTFAGCILSACMPGNRGNRRKILDCMSVAGCAAISLGRLGCFFTETNRGQIMSSLTGLPWAYPVANASGQLEYRFATFLFQAVIAAALGIFLAVVFFRKRSRDGDVTLLFVLCYSASQVILDSTRYDSLYLRSNGFISMVQVLSAVALVSVLVILCVRAIKVQGFRKWMVPSLVMLPVLLGCAGYMEYYVQRHGREAGFAYSIMGSCLAGIVILGLLFWKYCKKST